MSEWKHNDLGQHVILITKGTTPMSLGRSFQESGINFIKAESITDSGRIIRDSLAFIDHDTHSLLKRSQLISGDVLFSIAGVLGRVTLVGGEFIPANINQALALIRVKDKHEIDRLYLKYYLTSDYVKQQVRRINVQAAQANFSLADVNGLLVKYPKSIEVQRKIATILSTIDKVIEKTEAAIEKYKAIKAGMMQDLFTRGIDTQTGKLRPTIEEAPELYKKSELGWIPKEWDATEFKDACLEYINGGTPSTKNASNWVGNIPWITGADFLESFEVGFIRRHINEDALRYSSSHLIREGNILLVTRTGVGKLAIAPFDVAISQDITGIILDPSQYCVEFFYYYLQILVEDFKKMNQGTSINGIIRSDLEATLILKPSLDEQKQIAAVLRALDENLKKEQSNLSKYRDLKMGLMADLLTGKVRVNLNHDKVENR